MFQQFTTKFLLIVMAASVAAAQNLPPGTRCYRPPDGVQLPRCNRSTRNNPPTITLSVNADDKRKLELCATSALSGNECATLLGNINLLATANDPDDNNLLVTYSTTAGRITSEGHMAVWNLTANWGTYTATVEVDDGCGCVAFSSTTVTVTTPGPKWLNGIWEGTGYQFNTDATWPMMFSAADDNYTIDYPSLKCGGKWVMLVASSDSASFREEISPETENCTQGGTVRLKKLPSGELGFKYSRPGQTEIAAATILKLRKPGKKPAQPAKTGRSTTRSRR